jgi:hypothetical protein
MVRDKECFCFVGGVVVVVVCCCSVLQLFFGRVVNERNCRARKIISFARARMVSLI